MTTDTINTTAENIIDVDQLRAALLDLLTRANTALEQKPNGETSGDLAERLLTLGGEIEDLTHYLVLALPAIRILQTAQNRIAWRYGALCEVFGLPSCADDPSAFAIVTDAGEGTFWGEGEPVFPALGLDFTQKPIDYDSPF